MKRKCYLFQHWQHGGLHREADEVYLWYGDKIWSQQHTLDSIDPKELPEHRMAAKVYGFVCAKIWTTFVHMYCTHIQYNWVNTQECPSILLPDLLIELWFQASQVTNCWLTIQCTGHVHVQWIEGTVGRVKFFVNRHWAGALAAAGWCYCVIEGAGKAVTVNRLAIVLII